MIVACIFWTNVSGPLARAIHGDDGYQQRINQDCVMLVIEGEAERRVVVPFDG